MTRKEIGDRGEAAAAAFLEAKGYEILCRNYHCRSGELDIVARLDGILAFVEVKTRSAGSFGAPAEAVDYTKRKRIVLAASDYLWKRPADLQPRFDVVEVITRGVGDFSGCEIRHIENAFTTEGLL